MKKILMLVACMSITGVAQAEQSWWQSILSTVGLGDSETSETADTAKEQAGSAVSIDGLISTISENLGVTSDQAKGGVAALFNFAKQNISEEQFAAIGEKIPGFDSVMKYLPIITGANKGGAGGLLDMASGLSDEVAQVNDLKKQFDSLGLDAGMITKYADQAKGYFDTPEAEGAKNALAEAFSGFSL